MRVVCMVIENERECEIIAAEPHGKPPLGLLLLLVWPAQKSLRDQEASGRPLAHDGALSLGSFTLATPPGGVGRSSGHSNTLITLLRVRVRCPGGTVAAFRLSCYHVRVGEVIGGVPLGVRWRLGPQRDGRQATCRTRGHVPPPMCCHPTNDLPPICGASRRASSPSSCRRCARRWSAGASRITRRRAVCTLGLEPWTSPARIFAH